MKRLKVIVVGAKFGEVYLQVLLRRKDLVDVVGILGKGGQHSLECSTKYNIPLYTSVSELPSGIDLACVIVRAGVMGGEVEEMGFTIEWGGLPGKENNFFIWFGEEAFLEVFCIKRKFAPLVVAMQLVYGTVPAKKWWRWFSAKNMWCDFALEDDNDNMTKIVRKNKKTI